MGPCLGLTGRGGKGGIRMFEQTFVGGENTTRKASSVFISFLIQCGLVFVGILIPADLLRSACRRPS